MGKASRTKRERREPDLCPVPECTQPVSDTSRFGLCASCSRVASALLYILPRIKVQSSQSTTGRLQGPPQQQDIARGTGLLRPEDQPVFSKIVGPDGTPLGTQRGILGVSERR